MRSFAVALVAVLLLPGCTKLSELKNPDCGDSQHRTLTGDPWGQEPPSQLGFEEGWRTWVWSFAPDPEACINQHAKYTVDVAVAPPKANECVEIPGVQFTVKSQAGFFGSGRDVEGTTAADGTQTMQAEGEIGMGQFSEPQYLFVYTYVKMRGTPSETVDEVCARQRMQKVDISIDYKPSIERGEGTVSSSE